ncbi:hypothetical protein [Aurantimicrobium sp. MWH-Uga1]|uniref:hypothetical protein n=1 Tax=Aurantimicrobium sp. MWH-Uga1 TaxID=2079575 RepID=UPI000DEDF983|nr:hypothetical protein [Aurantimicrobium sp. MWH-Uga1]
MKLDLFSAPYPPHGATDGKAAQKAIGQTELSLWEVVFRETFQNSWDARGQGATPSFGFELQTISPQHLEVLSSEVFSEIPAGLIPLKAFLVSDKELPRDQMIIWDSGTRGLGGPMRADVVAGPGQRRDFVDFVFNVGRGIDKAIGGGTYGFGKGVIYAASTLSTCLVYSQTLVDGQINYRFIAISVADPYEFDGRLMTGRHWWGIAKTETNVEAVVGDEARRLAEQLGIDKIPGNSTGTVISILSPRKDSTTETSDLINEVINSAQKWAWPHMIQEVSEEFVSFSFKRDGVVASLTEISDHKDYKHFVSSFVTAYRNKESSTSSIEFPLHIKPVKLRTEPSHTGVLVYNRSIRHPADGVSNLNGTVALMRNPCIVVKYLQVAEPDSNEVLNGVFLASKLADEIFAKSEPVAHNDWALEPQQGTSPKPVRNTIRDIKKVFSTSSGNMRANTKSDPSNIARLSRILGKSLTNSVGKGSETVPTSRGGSGSRPKKLSVQLLPDHNLSRVGNQLVTDFSVKFSIPDSYDLSNDFVRATPRIALEPGHFEEVAAGEEAETYVICWLDGEGAILVEGPELPLGEVLNFEGIKVRLLQPRDLAITVQLKIEVRS